MIKQVQITNNVTHAVEVYPENHKEMKFMMDVAFRVSQESYDTKRKVGAVITKDRNILAYGYNGTATNSSNKMRDSKGEVLPTVIHAEQNAIAKLAKSTNSGDNATIYTTLFPCITCALSIIQSGIKRVVFYRYYKNNDALNLLLESGIELYKIEKDK